MAADVALTAALDVAWFAILAVAIVNYVRRRDRVHLAVLAVFACPAIVFGVPLLRSVVGELPPAATVLALVALLALPPATLWLLSQFARVPRPVLALALVLFAGSVGAFAAGALDERPVLLAAVGAFVGGELLAAGLFAREAERRAGVSRARLRTAAAATLLVGGAVGFLGVAAGTGAGSPWAASAARLAALAAALAYLLAFAPPLPLRRFSQSGVVFDFLRRLHRLPTGSPTDRIWAVLADTARAIGGATGVAVTVDAPGSGPRIRAVSGAWPMAADGAPLPEADAVADRRHGGRVVSVPIISEMQGPTVRGSVAMILVGNPLFVDDDLELLGLLVARAVRAAEREEALVERERLIDDLRRASAAKSDFLAAMSHELRTPLNAIIGFSELLARDSGSADGPDAETVGAYAGHIHESGLHLLELINDVLDLAKVEAGRLDLRPERLDLRELVAASVETMRPLAERKSQALVVDDGAPVEIEADPARVRQIVFNLLSNAIKFTPDGGRVEVALSAVEGRARLEVSDTGPGIAAEDQERIFEAFKQVGPGHARQEGTGLGLALTRQLVERHGGRIGVESTVGAGSRFIVLLPTVAPAAAAPAPAIPAAGAPAVLVIEDDHRAAELLRVYLGEAGYGVTTAGTGRDGLARAAEVQPAAIVLDIVLPDIDGWEVLQRLKRDPRTRDIPVLVASVVDDAQLGLALGAVDYFVKPVAREALLASLGRLTFTTKVRHAGVTVLVVDGDPVEAARYREVLGPEGFAVVIAGTAADGLARALADRPDLILVDLILPDLDGFELVTRLKADARTAAIPIWAVTRAALSPEDKARLNGRVLHVVERGDGAVAALRAWLERVGAGVASPSGTVASPPGAAGAAG